MSHWLPWAQKNHLSPYWGLLPLAVNASHDVYLLHPFLSFFLAKKRAGTTQGQVLNVTPIPCRPLLQARLLVPPAWPKYPPPQSKETQHLTKCLLIHVPSLGLFGVWPVLPNPRGTCVVNCVSLSVLPCGQGCVSLFSRLKQSISRWCGRPQRHSSNNPALCLGLGFPSGSLLLTFRVRPHSVREQSAHR